MNWKKRVSIYTTTFILNSFLGAMKRAFGVVAPALAAGLGINKAAVGSLKSVGLWARLIGLSGTSLLSDRNPKVILGIGAAIACAATVLMATSMSTYAVAFALFALYAAGNSVASYCSVATVVKERDMGTTLDTVPMSAAKNVSILIFGGMAILLLAKYGVGSVFLALGLGIVFSTILFLWSLKNVNMELKRRIKPNWGILKDKGIWRGVPFMVAYEGAYVGLATMGMFILKMAYKMPMKQLIALYVATLAIPALISRPFWGYIANKVTGARGALILAMIVQIIGLGLVLTNPLWGIGVFAVGTGAGTVCYLPYLADRWGRKRVGEVFGAMCIPYMALSACIPMAAGFVFQSWGLAAMIYGLIALCVVGLIAFGTESRIFYRDKRNG